MIVLGLDTATTATTVALQTEGEPARELRDDPAPGAHPGHATRLLGLAHELLATAGVGWAELGRIAVGTGPGGFTGLRVGIATARGLSQALDVELVGVSSLAALAAGALAGDEPPPERVLAVIDARRGEVFAAAYATDAEGRPLALVPARAQAPAAIAEMFPSSAALVGGAAPTAHAGAGIAGIVAVGDGAIRYRAELEAAGAAVPPDEAPAHRIQASAICSAGAAAAAPADRHEVVPEYLRRPDAELAFDGTR